MRASFHFGLCGRGKDVRCSDAVFAMQPHGSRPDVFLNRDPRKRVSGSATSGVATLCDRSALEPPNHTGPSKSAWSAPATWSWYATVPIRKSAPSRPATAGSLLTRHPSLWSLCLGCPRVSLTRPPALRVPRPPLILRSLAIGKR